MTDKEMIIINLYMGGLSLRKVADLSGYKSQNSVKNILIKNGVKIRGKSGFKKPFNESFFNVIDTEEKAYFLGFLTADGNVGIRKNSQPVIRMELGQRDRYILEKLRECLDIDISVKETRKSCCCLRLHSKVMFDDLNKYGIVPNKTGKEKFYRLQDDMMPHYIRGFFDGDGWVTNTTSHGKHKGKRKSIGFVSNHSFLNDLKNYLAYSINTNANIKIIDRKGCSMLLYSSASDTSKIIDYIYKDATIYLERKYDKCNYVYVNTEKGE